MADTFSKKEQQKKKAKKRQDKEERRADRKLNNDKGKSLEEMTIYLDEDGNFTNIPPDKQKKRSNNEVETFSENKRNYERATYTGTLALFFPDKNYGFISELNAKSNIFVHANSMKEAIKQGDSVTFEKEKTPKGYSAINVRKSK